MAAQHAPEGDYSTRYKFNGKELDEATGLYYYGARYYDPKISTWLSVDPLAEKYQPYSPYNYTLNNPINLIDPDGRSVKDWIEQINEEGKKSYVFDKNVKTIDDAKKAGYKHVAKVYKEAVISSNNTDKTYSYTLKSDGNIIDNSTNKKVNESFTTPANTIINHNDDKFALTFINKDERIKGGPIPVDVIAGGVLLAGLTKVSKASVGFKVLGKGASRGTLLSSTIFFKLGVRGSLGRKIWTPFGKASSWSTLLGRWSAPVGGGTLLYNWLSNKKEKNEKEKK